jgi:hypothetical protein
MRSPYFRLDKAPAWHSKHIEALRCRRAYLRRTRGGDARIINKVARTD